MQRWSRLSKFCPSVCPSQAYFVTKQTHSLIVSRIVYALPAWGGFVSVELCCKIDAMFKRLKRYGYTTDYLTFSDLLVKADSGLFCSMRRSYHCLHHALPPLLTVDNLRVRGHPYNLPDCSTNVQKNHLLSVLCRFHITFTCCCFTLFPPLCVFCSNLDLVFICFVIVLLLIAISCHCHVCVRLSHSIKDYHLLTYLYRHTALSDVPLCWILRIFLPSCNSHTYTWFSP